MSDPSPVLPAAGRSAGVAAAVRRSERFRRWLPWAALVLLLVVAQGALLWLTVAHESSRAQDEAEATAAEAAAATRRELLRVQQTLQAPDLGEPADGAWRTAAARVLAGHKELQHLERRDGDLVIGAWAASPLGPPLFDPPTRMQARVEADEACRAARRGDAPVASRSYFLPRSGGLGDEVIDLCLPVRRAGGAAGFVVGTVALAPLLETVFGGLERRRYEISLVEADGARLARAGAARGAGVYVATQAVQLPGSTLLLRADSAAGRPSVVPNLAVALVLGLSIALFGVLLLLVRDVRRRAAAEAALAEAYRFRKAMEDSLSTGLRARDLDGAVSYANPAFCTMVGFTLDELRSARPPAPPPYWPPEHAADYAVRQAARLSGRERAVGEPREGFETVFMRKNGERFPVMIYEAPLLDAHGAQTGWMSAVLDVSAQRQVEELSRQQQERLQASARLASVGEMASLLSHELNQPLAAIASYAHGSLNLLDQDGGDARTGDAAGSPQGSPHGSPNGSPNGSMQGPTQGLVRQALTRIAEQAERAGRVIKSVHQFVRRREQPRESLSAALLIDSVLPLARLQARKSGARIEAQLPEPPLPTPRVHCDRTMVEQVLLNLTRNGIQAMEHDTPPAERVLTLRVEPAQASVPGAPGQAGRVRFAVVDAGTGIAADVAARLFTPFFTTRPEGMGLGLSLCRSVLEQHGSRLEFGPGPGGRGTVFTFTLPAARSADAAPAVSDLAGVPADVAALGEDPAAEAVQPTPVPDDNRA